MIYITGDTHGEQMRFAQFMQIGAALWNEDDVLEEIPPKGEV